ncbi:hypothetical protein V865_001775 [Kwoniella europaea PYCC6329]|uniref:Uncharacterized protein n=1 Tax=Kwoniella europaea PYCC6329 TaxID=1423913 RepID=A0AAX4KCL9_9TREE
MALPKSLRIFDPCIVLKIPSKRPTLIVPRRGETQREYLRRKSLQGDDNLTSTTPYYDMIEYEIKYKQAIFAMVQKMTSCLPNLQEGSVWEIHQSVDGREDGWLRWTWIKVPPMDESGLHLETSRIVIDASPVPYANSFTSNYRSRRVGRILSEDEDSDSD